MRVCEKTLDKGFLLGGVYSGALAAGPATIVICWLTQDNTPLHSVQNAHVTGLAPNRQNNFTPTACHFLFWV